MFVFEIELPMGDLVPFSCVPGVDSNLSGRLFWVIPGALKGNAFEMYRAVKLNLNPGAVKQTRGPFVPVLLACAE